MKFLPRLKVLFLLILLGNFAVKKIGATSFSFDYKNSKNMLKENKSDLEKIQAILKFGKALDVNSKEVQTPHLQNGDTPAPETIPPGL